MKQINTSLTSVCWVQSYSSSRLAHLSTKTVRLGLGLINIFNLLHFSHIEIKLLFFMTTTVDLTCGKGLPCVVGFTQICYSETTKLLKKSLQAIVSRSGHHVTYHHTQMGSAMKWLELDAPHDCKWSMATTNLPCGCYYKELRTVPFHWLRETFYNHVYLAFCIK